MSALSVSLRSDLHAAAPVERDCDLEAQHYQERTKVFNNLDAQEVFCQLIEAESVFLAALRREDPELIGRVVLNVCRAYAESVADGVVFGSVCKSTPSVEKAAGMAMLGKVYASEVVA